MNRKPPLLVTTTKTRSDRGEALGIAEDRKIASGHIASSPSPSRSGSGAGGLTRGTDCETGARLNVGIDEGQQRHQALINRVKAVWEFLEEVVVMTPMPSCIVCRHDGCLGGRPGCPVRMVNTCLKCGAAWTNRAAHSTCANMADKGVCFYCWLPWKPPQSLAFGAEVAQRGHDKYQQRPCPLVDYIRQACWFAYHNLHEELVHSRLVAPQREEAQRILQDRKQFAHWMQQMSPLGRGCLNALLATSVYVESQRTRCTIATRA